MGKNRFYEQIQSDAGLTIQSLHDLKFIKLSNHDTHEIIHC